MTRIGLRGGLALVAGVGLLASGVTASASAPKLGPRTVVRAPRWTISTRTVDHWLRVAAISQALVSRSPVIVPTDPPSFARCVREVRRKVPSLAHARARTLRKDCRRRFATLSRQVLDFLIKAQWYEQLASADHITITHERVVQAFRRARRRQFPTRSGFRAYLRQTGQTITDVLFRFRVNLAFTALLKRTHLSPAKAQQRLDREVLHRYRARTICARYYVTPDCGNFRAHRHG